MHTRIKAYTAWTKLNMLQDSHCSLLKMAHNSNHHFQKILLERKTSQTTSSPNFTQSNRLAEKSVQMAKDILIKTDMAGNNFGLALLE